MNERRIDKIFRIGKIYCGRVNHSPVFVHVRYNGKGLSFTGVEGPMRNGHAHGGCGQIRPYAYEEDDYMAALDIDAAWTETTVRRLFALWRAWHLNDMRAGCEHQRAEGWDKRPIDPDKPSNTYGKHFEGQCHDSWNLLGWVRPDEHPDGLLTRPCDEYGTKWLTEEVPSEVLDELAAMPESPVEPAWI